MCTQSIPELVSVVANEMPIDTTTAYVEATETMDLIVSSVLKIENLVGNAFLMSEGRMAKSLSSLVLADRIKDIAYVRFVCHLDTEQLDGKVSQSPGSFHFCLKLPQSYYDPGTKLITDIFSPTNSLKNGPTNSSPGGVNLFATPTQPNINTPVATTPNMDRLIRMSKNNNQVISYFGPMTFLDCQTDFDAVFGREPTIYSSNPGREVIGESITSQINAFPSKCMFDTFISICKTDYVGVDSKGSVGKMTQEICKQITSIAMEVRTSGCTTLLTPDKLYSKYISTVAGLPLDASTWSITLCSSFFNCLIVSIQDKMEDDDFIMPPLNCQSTKTLQLGAIRVVRVSAAASYKSLVDEEK